MTKDILDQVEEGKTTESELNKLLGEIDSVEYINDSKVLFYLIGSKIITSRVFLGIFHSQDSESTKGTTIGFIVRNGIVEFSSLHQELLLENGKYKIERNKLSLIYRKANNRRIEKIMKRKSLE